MDLYWKFVGAMLVSVILGLHIGKNEKDLSILLTMAVCCLGGAAVVTFLDPVITLLRDMGTVIQTKDNLLSILLKCAGIALVSEMAELICRDAGSSSLGKMTQMLGSAVILYLSVPMITVFLTLLQDFLDKI